jgi:hypothetical protein
MQIKAIWIAVVTLAACIASAQDAFDLRVADASLTGMLSVRQDLALSKQQDEDLAKLNRAYAAEAEKNPKQRDVIKANKRKAILAKLSAGQLKRLAQITMQQYGASLLATPVVGDKLGITADQRKSIAQVYQQLATDIQASYRRAIRDAMAPLVEKYGDGGLKREGVQREIAEATSRATEAINLPQMRQTADHQAIGVLTEAQAAAWKALLGKPFTSELPSPVGTAGRPPQP